MLKSGLHVKYELFILKINPVMAIFIYQSDEKSQSHKIKKVWNLTFEILVWIFAYDH